MKQTTLEETEKIGVCRHLIVDNKICGTKLTHYLHGLIDYWYCAVCSPEILEQDKRKTATELLSKTSMEK